MERKLSDILSYKDIEKLDRSLRAGKFLIKNKSRLSPNELQDFTISMYDYVNYILYENATEENKRFFSTYEIKERKECILRVLNNLEVNELLIVLKDIDDGLDYGENWKSPETWKDNSFKSMFVENPDVYFELFNVPSLMQYFLINLKNREETKKLEGYDIKNILSKVFESDYLDNKDIVCQVLNEVEIVIHNKNLPEGKMKAWLERCYSELNNIEDEFSSFTPPTDVSSSEVAFAKSALDTISYVHGIREINVNKVNSLVSELKNIQKESDKENYLRGNEILIALEDYVIEKLTDENKLKKIKWVNKKEEVAELVELPYPAFVARNSYFLKGQNSFYETTGEKFSKAEVLLGIDNIIKLIDEHLGENIGTMELSEGEHLFILKKPFVMTEPGMEKQQLKDFLNNLSEKRNIHKLTSKAENAAIFLEELVQESIVQRSSKKGKGVKF